MTRKAHLLLSAILVPVLTISTALAQEEAGVLEEVLVTAEKREVSIQDVPIAISAFTAETRDALGIITGADIANFTPGMSYNSSPNRISIRGIGRTENSLGSEPGVAIYQDGIYTNEATVLRQSTFFTERIEVLRGPQGTLYGRNSIGGAINVISKRPTEEFSGQTRVGFHDNGGVYAAFSLSGPIGEKFRYLFGAELDKHDGWVENLAGGDQNDQDFRRWQVQAEWDITERLAFWVKYEDYEYDNNRVGNVMVSPYNTESPGAPIGDFNTDFQQLVPNPQLGYPNPNPAATDPNVVRWNETGYTHYPGDKLVVNITYDFDKAQLKYIYGNSEYDFEYLGDGDFTDRTDIQYLEYTAQIEEYDQHELQLISNLDGKFQYVVGLFRWENENFQPVTAFSPTNPVLQTPVFADPAGLICFCVTDAPPNPQGIYYDQWGDLETKSTAVYGQLDFYPNDKWHVSLGLRYTEDEKTGSEYQRIIFDGQGTYAFIFNTIGMSWFNVMTPTPGPQARIAWDLSLGGRTATHTDDWDSTDWSLGTSYRFDDDSMLFGRISTGYKAGGYRLGSLQPNPAVDQEEVLAYEIGYKKQTERVIFNAAAYYNDYEDMQVPINAIINGVNNSLFYNAEKANQWGIELDAQWAATDALIFYATYAYLNSEIETMGIEVIDSTEQFPEPSDLAGNELILSPEHQFSLIGDYTWQFNSGALNFVASYIYTDEQWSSIFNRPDTQLDSSSRVDFRLNWFSNKRDLRVTGYIRNAFDEDISEYRERLSWYFNHQIRATYQPPRVIGIEVNYGF